MVRGLIVCFLVVGFGHHVFAQSESPIFPNLWDLLQNREFVEELGLTDEQVKLIESQRSDADKAYFEQSKEARKSFPEVLGPAELAKVNEIKNNRALAYEAALSNNLLQSQVKRLGEIAFWYFVNEQGMFATLNASTFRKSLSLSEEQIGDLKKETFRLQAEFDQELFELRQKYRERLAEKMNEEFRKTMKQKFGEPCIIGSLTLPHWPF